MFSAAEKEVFKKYGIPPEVGLIIIREVQRQEFACVLECVSNLNRNVWRRYECERPSLFPFRHVHYELESVDECHRCNPFCRKSFESFMRFRNGVMEYERKALRYWSSEYRKENGRRKLSYVPMK